ncbi:MAG: hypothetical protein H7A25_23360 [Leptospiraceae bacterium]|nr:hypothetical protein [Leptospiraceae bacterium]MCP5502858.1 hypothetical protein [Leptospiraceae bacterium]
MEINYKPDPYILALRKMTPEQRVMKMFELTDMTRYLLKRGLEIQFPEKSKEEIHEMYLQRLMECHNSNY